MYFPALNHHQLERYGCRRGVAMREKTRRMEIQSIGLIHHAPRKAWPGWLGARLNAAQREIGSSSGKTRLINPARRCTGAPVRKPIWCIHSVSPTWC